MLDEISQEKQLLKSSAVIMFFNVLGLASALLLDILIAARFSLGTQAMPSWAPLSAGRPKRGTSQGHRFLSGGFTVTETATREKPLPLIKALDRRPL